MNCNIVREKIYKQVYTDTREFDDELMRHLNDCPACNSYYKDCRSVKKITSLLNQKQAVLNNPKKLTNDILDSLNEIKPKKKSTGFYISINAKRFLAAASVCLMIVFAYEQYVAMEKIIKLEEQMSLVPEVPVNSYHYAEILSNYPRLKIEIIQSELASGVFELRDNDMKSLFIKAGLGILSHEAIAKRLQNQLTNLKFSNKDRSVINKIKNE